MRCNRTAPTLAAFVLIAACTSPLTAAWAAPGNEQYTEYEGKNLSDYEAKRKLTNKPIVVKDVYDESVSTLPRDLTRRNVNLRIYAAFRAQEGVGSGLLCLVPLKDKDAAATLKQLVRGNKVLLYGQIRRVGSVYVFLLDKLYRGHEKPVSKAILVTVASSPVGGKKRVYRLAEPGKIYRVYSPHDNRPIYVSFQPQ